MVSWAARGLGGLPTPLLVLGAGIMHGTLLLLLVSVESQFDSFNVLRQELLKLKREGRKKA